MQEAYDPNRDIYYTPVVPQQAVPVEPVMEQPVVPVQPVAQRMVAQPVVPVQPVAQPVMPQPVVPVAPANQAVAETQHSMRGDVRMETGRKTYVDNNGNLMEREEQVFEDPRLARVNVLDRTARIVYFIIGVFEVLLLLRFVFRLMGAGANGLVNLIYNITGPMVIPLNGIFNDQSLSRTNVLEISTLLAMVVWALIGWGIVKLLYLVLEPSPTTRSVYTTSRRRRLE